MTGDDLVEGGLDGRACQEIAGRLNELGLLDYFNVIGSSAETYRTEAAAIPDMSFPEALYCPLAAAIKAVVTRPGIAPGRINHPAVAERVLHAGQADLCVMTRALIADPELPNKAQEGRLDDIRPCFGYNEGCIDRIYTGRGVTCVHNAVIGRETLWTELPRAAGPRKVVIGGGGPGGLECARVARLRGHHVVLLEKTDELGGQTLIARRAPARADFDGACRYAAAQCRKLGVEIRLAVEADAAVVLREVPDVVVIATGARALRPALPGIEHGLSGWDLAWGQGGARQSRPRHRRGVWPPGPFGRRVPPRPWTRGPHRDVGAEHRHFPGRHDRAAGLSASLYQGRADSLSPAHCAARGQPGG